MLLFLLFSERKILKFQRKTRTFSQNLHPSLMVVVIIIILYWDDRCVFLLRYCDYMIDRKECAKRRNNTKKTLGILRMEKIIVYRHDDMLEKSEQKKVTDSLIVLSFDRDYTHPVEKFSFSSFFFRRQSYVSVEHLFLSERQVLQYELNRSRTDNHRHNIGSCFVIDCTALTRESKK